MLNQIKLFFEKNLLPSETSNNAEAIQLAAAVLFLEMMTMDDKIEQQEQQVIQACIEQHFALTTEQTTTLIALAEQEKTTATDYFQFTSLINKTYTEAEKINLIKVLWQIACADGILDVNEEYFVRKISELLYVPHTAFIMSKNQVVDHAKTK